jgi:hypothetical protein
MESFEKVRIEGEVQEFSKKDLYLNLHICLLDKNNILPFHTLLDFDIKLSQ